MIKSLRKRIVAINVLTTCIILFVAVIFTFTWGITRINDERDGQMELALNLPLTDYTQEQSKQILDEIVVVYYNTETGEGFWFGEKRDEASEKLKDELAKLADSSMPDEGYLWGYSVRYMKAAVTDANGDATAFVKIAFSNLASRYGTMKYSWFVFGSLGFGLIAYCIISVSLARMALAPVEESWKKQKQFVADASHELKTPLSVIMANTDIIMSHRDESVESQMKWLENTRSESQRMADLVADLLFLAKNDDGLKVQLEDVNLSDCVSSIVLGYDAVFYENKKAFTYDIAPDLHVTGNVKQLKQLATILLDNANKYSKDIGNIKLTLSSSGKNAVLAVQNDSEQLTDEQLQHLFDRFYTVDPSRNKNNGGNGLGLSIAKTICENHEGTIKVTCVDGVAEFIVTLPLKKK